VHSKAPIMGNEETNSAHHTEKLKPIFQRLLSKCLSAL